MVVNDLVAEVFMFDALSQQVMFHRWYPSFIPFRVWFVGELLLVSMFDVFTVLFIVRLHSKVESRLSIAVQLKFIEPDEL